jgi:hypothetical protein
MEAEKSFRNTSRRHNPEDKIRSHKVMTVSVLTYGSETLTVTKRDQSQVQRI